MGYKNKNNSMIKIDNQELRDELGAQLAEIAYVNAKGFGAKGDGITDDTISIQQAIDALENGGIFILPEGTYRVSKIDFSSKKNCTFYIYGKIKMIDNIPTPYGIVVAGGVNNTFFGLDIDGNRTNAIDEGRPGETCNLLINTSAKNLTFNNISLTESAWCASIFNGKAENVVFNNLNMVNVGEHGFYVSGGLNKNITWKNVTIDSLCLNPNNVAISHECYFVKSRGNSYGDNSDFHFENINQTQTTPATTTTIFAQLAYGDNFFADKVTLGDKVYPVLASTNGKKMEFNHLTTRSTIVYNYSAGAEIIIRNSKISGTQTRFDCVKLYDTCEFDVNKDWNTQGDASFATKFKNCTFKANYGLFKRSHFTQDMEFIDCKFTDVATVSSGNHFMTVGATSYTAGKFIRFDNCHVGDMPNYSQFLNFLKPVIIEIFNSVINEAIGGTNGDAHINNLRTSVDSTALMGQKATGSKGNGVWVNGEDYARKKIQLTITSGATASGKYKFTYTTFRLPTIADLQVTPITNLGGIVNFTPLIDDVGGTIQITSDVAPSASVTFNVLIDVTQ